MSKKNKKKTTTKTRDLDERGWMEVSNEIEIQIKEVSKEIEIQIKEVSREIEICVPVLLTVYLPHYLNFQLHLTGQYF